MVELRSSTQYCCCPCCSQNHSTSHHPIEDQCEAELGEGTPKRALDLSQGTRIIVPMRWVDAAAQVLKKTGKPLDYKELASTILEEHLLDSQSQTPHVTLHASVSLENKVREERGIAPRFKIERGQISLLEWKTVRSSSVFLGQASRHRDIAKSDLLRALRGLNGAQFESYIEALLVKMGYDNVEIRGGPGDEGIDLLCEMSQGINIVKTAVQAKCKLSRNKVGPKDVRLLRDVLPKFKCSQGVLITTSGFTKAAEEAANEEGRLPIILIDAEVLTELAIEHEVGVRSQSVKTYFFDEDFEIFES